MPADVALYTEVRSGNLLAVCFAAFDQRCEILLPAMDRAAGLEIAAPAAREAWRLEAKYGRDRDDSVLAWIHRHRDREVEVDRETAALIDDAKRCFELSEGMLDVARNGFQPRRRTEIATSGSNPETSRPATSPPVGSDPGFGTMEWDPPRLRIPRGTQLDLDALARQYAADRAYEILSSMRAAPFLVNLADNVRVSGPGSRGPWQVPIARASRPHEPRVVELEHGALVTVRERVGAVKPSAELPRVITVLAASCREAGLLATLAQGKAAGAREFLAEQWVQFWIDA